jgi:Ca-activated chloride channel family protein
MMKRYWMLVSGCLMKKRKGVSHLSSIEHQASSIAWRQSIGRFLHQLVGLRCGFTRKRFGLFIRLGVCSLLPLLSPNPGHAADPPDKLYRQGRYGEAEKAYAEADMDHPKDIRFRYNRGCAAFQNGQYKEAGAAFASVMRRAKDGELRFRAAYNLGNSAYKQGDYASAATYFKEALAANPESQDARYNLELSLRAIEQRKPKQSESPDADPERSDKREKEKEEKNSQKNKSSQKQKAEKKDQKKKDTSSGDSENRPGDSKTEDSPASGGNQKQGSNQNQSPEKELDEDAPGELRLRQALSELKEKNGEPQVDNATIDKKRAEALLNNVQENPSELLRFMFSEENRQGTASGRDW